MTNKQNVILKGLIELSDIERAEVIREAQGYKTKTFSEQINLNERLEKSQKVLGPISGASCPCCGR